MEANEIEARATAARRKSKLEWYEREIEKRGASLGAIFRELQTDTLKPYLLSHESFEHYCQDRWGMTPRRAQQLAAGESVRAQLADAPDTRDIAPTLNEGQLREVAKIPVEKRAEVLTTASRIGGKRMTAKTIRRAKAVVIDAVPVDQAADPNPPHRCPACGHRF